MDSVGWDATGRPLTDQLVHELAQHQPEYHPLRQLYREALTNQLSVQSAVLAVCILVIMFWATRLFLRFMFWLFDRVNDWRTGGVVVLAPFESQAYWEREYARHPERFEWYAEYRDLRPLLIRNVKPGRRVLHIGCGTSGLGTALHRDTGVEVVNADVSARAVQLAREAAQRAGVRQGLSFVEADAMALPDSWEGTFDVVIDKGTLDALSCSRSEGEDNVRRMLSEIHRVLTPGGVCILVTTVKEASVRRWVSTAMFRVVDLAHLVTRQSQRRVPVLPNDAYVLRKRRRRRSGAAGAAGLRFRGAGAPGAGQNVADDSSDTDSGSSGSDGDVSSGGDSDVSSFTDGDNGGDSDSDSDDGGGGSGRDGDRPQSAGAGAAGGQPAQAGRHTHGSTIHEGELQTGLGDKL